MSILDFLSPGLTAATTVASGYENAQAKAKQAQIAQRIQDMQAKRQAEQDAIRDQLTQAQIQNYKGVEADRVADNKRQNEKAVRDFILSGGVPAHTEKGQPVGALSATKIAPDPQEITLHQPGMPESVSSEIWHVNDVDTDPQRVVAPAIAGTDTPLAPMSGAPAVKDIAPPVLSTPDVEVPDSYDPSGDRAVVRNRETLGNRSELAALANETRLNEGAANRATRANEGAANRDSRERTAAAGRENAIVLEGLRAKNRADLQQKYGSRITTEGQWLAEVGKAQRAYMKVAADAGKPISPADAQRQAMEDVNTALGKRPATVGGARPLVPDHPVKSKYGIVPSVP